MSDFGIVEVGLKTKSFEKRAAWGLITKVSLVIDEDTAIESGDDTGRTLYITCPYATQPMADDLLEKLTGLRYQPYEAGSAYVDPRAEIGDGVIIGGLYGGLYTQNLRFGRSMASDIGAPSEKELNHEYKYVSLPERRYLRGERLMTASISLLSDRIVAEVVRSEEAEQVLDGRIDDAVTDYRARFEIQADEISAKVSKTGSNTSNTFSWALTSDSAVYRANSTEVLRIDSNGLTVKGSVTATSGTIGGCVIDNGVLKVGSANITSLNASVIDAGTLNVDRLNAGSISTTKLADYAVTTSKINGSAVTSVKLGTDASNNIAQGMSAYGVTSGATWANYINSREANLTQLQTQYMKLRTSHSSSVYNRYSIIVDSDGYVRASSA